MSFQSSYPIWITCSGADTVTPDNDAETFTAVENSPPGLSVRTWKLKEVAPAGIVTDGGTLTRVAFALTRFTTVGAGAGPLRLSVPVEGLVAATEVGLSVIEISRTNVNCVVTLLPANEAVIVTGPC